MRSTGRATGHPPLPIRLVAGLFILKHLQSLSDEQLCARWVENPYFQYLCGEHTFQHKAPFDRSWLTRWRERLDEERLSALLQESLRGMLYMGSQANPDGLETITVTFKLGTDPDLAQQLVENRVNQADARLPQEACAGRHHDQELAQPDDGCAPCLA